MFCPHCGQQIRDDSNFCWKCGVEIQNAMALVPSASNYSTPARAIELRSSKQARATFQQVMYRSDKQSWLEFIPKQVRGELAVYDNWLEFRSRRECVALFPIRRLSLENPMITPIQNAIRVDYGETDPPRVAYFLDFGLLGWRGIFGGTNRMMAQVSEILGNAGALAEISFKPRENEGWKRVASAIGTLAFGLPGLVCLIASLTLVTDDPRAALVTAIAGMVLLGVAIEGLVVTNFWREVDTLSGLQKVLAVGFCFLGMFVAFFSVVGVVALAIAMLGGLAGSRDES